MLHVRIFRRGLASKAKPARPANPLPHTSSVTTVRAAETTPQDPQQLPAHEKAKALMLGRISGTFTTVSFEAQKDMPLYGSLMPYVLHQRWPAHPIIALRADEKHSENIKNVVKSALTIFPLTPKAIVPSELPLPRLNITGDVKQLTAESDLKIILDRYAQIHPGSEKYLQDLDLFKFYEFAPSDVHYMKSTGELEVFAAEEFERAKEDPIAPHSRKMIERMNSEFPLELREIIKEFGDWQVSEAFIFAVDRLGFDMMGRDAETGNWTEFRLPWPYQITDVTEYETHLRQTAIDMQNKRRKQAQQRDE